MDMERLSARITDKYICVLLLVFPLWTGFEGYAAITRWKWLFYAAATALWCAALIYALARERERPRPDPLLAALAAALALWGALSLALSPWDVPVTGWYCDGLLMTLFYTLTALGVSAFGTMRLRYVNLLGVSVLLCCAVAWLQLFGLNPLWLYPEGMDYYGSGVQYTGAFLGTIGNTNMLGGFLAVAAPLLAFTAVRERGRELWLSAPALAAVVTAASAKSEAALVGMGVSALVGAPYYVYRRSRAAGRALICVLALALIAAALGLYLFDPGAGTLHELHELLHGRAEPSFGSSRFAIWDEGLRLFSERPLLGGGQGSFGFRSALEFERYVPETGLTISARADNAHSMYLACLVDLGLPGLALYLALTACALRRSSGTPALFALLAYYAQGLFSSEYVFSAPIAALLIGLAFGGSRRTKQRME